MKYQLLSQVSQKLAAFLYSSLMVVMVLLLLLVLLATLPFEGADRAAAQSCAVPMYS